MAISSWREAASLVAVVFRRMEVDVWKLNNDSNEVARELYILLSQDEKVRAARFQHNADRVAYVISRGALRVLLAEQVDFAPERLIIDAGNHGKPFLSVPSSTGVEFNLTHTTGYSYLAFSRIGPLGVDLEYINRKVDSDSIAGKFYHPEEITWLQRLPITERTEGFFRLWVRKEALAKGVGVGLGLELSHYSLLGPAGEEILVNADELLAHRMRNWRVFDLECCAEYTGALAICAQS